MSVPKPRPTDEHSSLKVLSFNVWGLAFISKDRPARISAIADHLSTTDHDIVCLQEIWIYKDYEHVRDIVSQNLPYSRFFHTGALGSGLAIFTKFPIISAEAHPYSLSGLPHHATAGDFFVNKAAGSIVILHPFLGEVEIWNTHMHAAGEHPPDTRQAHRIAQAWQLANLIRSGAAKGRYILAMGDFNSQPHSIPVQILRTHAGVSDSFLDTHPDANTATAASPTDALKSIGMTCDSSLNTWSAHKGVPQHIYNKGGKRLDYIFYRQPEIARRRPLIWGHREAADGSASASGSGSGTGQEGDGTELEQGKPLDASLQRAPRLRCVSSEVIMTDRIPGRGCSYSDHFGLCSTFAIDPPESARASPSAANGSGRSFSPLLDKNDPNPSVSSLNHTQPAGHTRPPSPSSQDSAKSSVIRNALHTLRMYTRISQTTSKFHLRLFAGAIVALLALTVGSAWQPKSWLQPIFTLLGGAIGAGGATMLYLGFVWGRWELGLLTEVTEEMELELRVSEMEERGEWS